MIVNHIFNLALILGRSEFKSLQIACFTASVSFNNVILDSENLLLFLDILPEDTFEDERSEDPTDFGVPF